MKKPAICALAIIVGFLLSELVVGQIVGYPRYVTGRKDYIIHDSLGPYNKITVWPPYYSTWSVEGGNNVVSRNNIGFYGADVESDSDSKYVLLLGDSFIEAGQYPGNEIAAGHLQRSISNSRSDLQVINLGASGQDPYTLWYRLLFFEKYYPPEKVILVYESFSRLKLYLSRWNPIFEYDRLIDPVEVKDSNLVTQQRIVRSASAFANLLVSWEAKKTNDTEQEDAKSEPVHSISDEQAYYYLCEALSHYQVKV